MMPSDAWNIYTGENTFMSWAKIVDCGDVRMTYLDNTVALKQLDKAHQVSYIMSGSAWEFVSGLCYVMLCYANQII